jgi:(2Fe-2S) ferredoxin
VDGDLAKLAKEVGVHAPKRHLFLCCDQSKPKCCSKEVGLASWEFLKSRLAGLDDRQPRLLRTKANCLRICERGPIAVVYPDDVWYHSCTAEVLGRIVDEHLVGGRPVEEFRIPAPAEPDWG